MRALVALVLLVAASARADSYRVTSELDDGGPGTFRWAIESANAHPGFDNIDFVVTTIRPASQLPSIRDDVNMNSGYGYGVSAMVEIDGSAAGDASGIVVESGAAYLTNIVVNRFARNGIELRGSNAYLDGCRVGTTRDGTEAQPNGGDALLIAGNGNKIVNGLFCASAIGIHIHGNDNFIYQNHVGLGAQLQPLGNRGDGIVIDAGARENVIGRFLEYCSLCGVRPSTNRIGANEGNGVVLHGEANDVSNNVVGGGMLDPPYGNRGNGIVVDGSSNTIAGGYFSFNGGSGVVVIRGSNPVVREVQGMCNGARFLKVDDDSQPPSPPELTAAVADASATSVDGSFDGQAQTTHKVVVFGAGSGCAVGLRPAALNSYPVTTDAHGHAAFRTGISSSAANVTAYVVDPSGMPSSSSEIATEQRGSAIADLSVGITTDRSVVAVRDLITVTVTITNHGPATVPAAWPSGFFPGTTVYDTQAAACYPYCVLPAGESATWIYERRVTDCCKLHFSAEAFTVDSIVDPNPDNNSATLEVVASDLLRRRAVGR